jgi:pyridoxamine 5'-phosphate oxidase-like protein
MRNADFEAIPAEQCWGLLKTVSIGRLALSVRALPAILPVQYYLDGDEIAACLGFFEVPLQAVRHTVVAFAADAFDEPARTGWSVQAQGTVRLDHQLDEAACGDPTFGTIVRLTPATMSGHRVKLCPLLGAAASLG